MKFVLPWEGYGDLRNLCFTIFDIFVNWDTRSYFFFFFIIQRKKQSTAVFYCHYCNDVFPGEKLHSVFN